MHTISPSKGPFTSSLLSFPSFLCHGAKRKFVSFYKKLQVFKINWICSNPGFKSLLSLGNTPTVASTSFTKFLPFQVRILFLYVCLSICLSLSLCLSVFLVDLCLSGVYLFIRRESSKYVGILQMFERIEDLLTYFSGVTETREFNSRVATRG